MTAYPKITLKKNKDQAVKRSHPWIFSGAIDHIEGNPSDGDLVKVFAANNDFLAIGHYSPGSIAIRILTTNDGVYNEKSIFKSIYEAYQLRIKLGLINNKLTNVYRLIFGEGDNLSGLIIDIYNKTAVIQTHTSGMYRMLDEITKVLIKLYGDSLEAVYFKGSETLTATKGIKNHYLYGTSKQIICIENGIKFHIDIEEGQKTGFFIDQRENRNLLSKYSANSRVLNLFSYNGAFSIYSLINGAQYVHSVDSSRKACDWAEKNTTLNDLDISKHKIICEDAIDYIHHSKEKYDLMIIDPPAFAKHLSARHNALNAYKRLNLEVLKKIDGSGIIFTFSCSQVVDRNMFNSIIYSAAIESGRKIRILHHLTQPADHPANIYFPEGEYLKGLVLYVE
jgi:23S rRNA (cytosine1962-C5)-methyltransferase